MTAPVIRPSISSSSHFHLLPRALAGRGRAREDGAAATTAHHHHHHHHHGDVDYGDDHHHYYGNPRPPPPPPPAVGIRPSSRDEQPTGPSGANAPNWPVIHQFAGRTNSRPPWPELDAAVQTLPTHIFCPGAPTHSPPPSHRLLPHQTVVERLSRRPHVPRGCVQQRPRPCRPHLRPRPHPSRARGVWNCCPHVSCLPALPCPVNADTDVVRHIARF